MKICSKCGTTETLVWAHPRTTVVGEGRSARIEKCTKTLCTPCYKEHMRLQANFHNRKSGGRIDLPSTKIKSTHCSECSARILEWVTTKFPKHVDSIELLSVPRKVCVECRDNLKSERRKKLDKYNREKMKEEDPEGYRFTRLREKYKISRKEFNRIKDQITCEICGGDNNGKTLLLDHCHDTGQIRGVLCRGCNFSLGHFNDSLELMDAADLYLEAYEYKFRS